MDIEVGQLLEFIEPVNVEGRVIERGTRARVGYILTEVVEPKLTLVLLGAGKPDTVVVDRHVAGLHCRVVSEAPTQERRER
jgi:hypothetical protein